MPVQEVRDTLCPLARVYFSPLHAYLMNLPPICHNVYRRLTLFFLFLLPALPIILCAQEKKEVEMGYIGFMPVDGFYEKPLEKAHVTAYEADSTTVLCDSLEQSWSGGWVNGVEVKEFSGFRFWGPQRAVIVLKVECEGYPTTYLRQQVADKKGKIPPKFIFDTPLRIWPETGTQLGEATVNASRILMVMKGDTIEYNAAAFRMAEGSMLDNLVRALPGVKLDNDGRITVNGEFVKSLLVNGRDFFKGDPKVALSNLPAYTVNKVKVYRKESERDKLRADRTAEERRKDPLVMDVVLKREYAQGWISNYEVAAGSNLKGGFDERWLARLFAMRYTNHSSLAVYANANNLNDDTSPGSKGEWKKIDPAAGEKKTYMGGVDFTLEPKDSKLKFNTSLQAQRQETQLSQTTFQENYYPTGSSFRQTRLNADNTRTEIKWNGSLKASSTGESHYIRISPSAYYIRDKQAHDTYNAEQQQYADYGGKIDSLYTRTLKTKGKNTGWGTSVSIYGWIPLFKWFLDFSGDASYNRKDDDKTEYDCIVTQGGAAGYQPEIRQYALPSFDYTYGGTLSYEIRTKSLFDTKWRPIIQYAYRQTFRSGHQDRRFREGEQLTPSTLTAAEWNLDEQNSWHTTRLERLQTVNPQLRFDSKCVHFGVAFPLNFAARRIDDFRESTPRHKSFHDFTFNPEFDLSWGAGKQITDFTRTHSGRFEAKIENELPILLYLLDVRDASDPMDIYRGNEELRKTQKYLFETVYEYRTKEYAQMLRLKGTYAIYHNAVSMARLYDRTTGVTTHLPRNIDGNRQATASLNYTRFLDKKNLWNLSLAAQFRHARSVDFADDEGQETPRALAAKNISQKGEVRVDYRTGQLTLGAKAALEWTRMRSESHAFTTFDYYDYQYGLTLATPLFWDIDLATDLMAYCHRGYADPAMNTTDWVWNAQLSKAFGRRKQWVVKATGFDLLHQIANVRRNVNAQGRTETWYNTIPAYATIHVVFRLDVLPKQKGIGEKRQ